MKFKCNKNLIYSLDLAEFIGVMIGDSCLFIDKKSKFHTVVSLDKREIQYSQYIKKLFQKLFQDYSMYINKLKFQNNNVNISKYVGYQLLKLGISPGNKIITKSTTPTWIFERKKFIIRFIRGVFDTDGCIYRKYDDYAQIQFKFG